MFFPLPLVLQSQILCNIKYVLWNCCGLGAMMLSEDHSRWYLFSWYWYLKYYRKIKALITSANIFLNSLNSWICWKYKWLQKVLVYSTMSLIKSSRWFFWPNTFNTRFRLARVLSGFTLPVSSCISDLSRLCWCIFIPLWVPECWLRIWIRWRIRCMAALDHHCW